MAFTPLSEKYRARQAATRRSLPSLRGACASHAAIKPVRSAAMARWRAMRVAGG